MSYSFKTKTAIKTLIQNVFAVIVSFLMAFYFTTLFHEPTSIVGALWAVISAIIVLEETHTDTFVSAKNRIIGAFIGAIISAFYLLFFNFSIFGFVIAIGSGVLLCFLLDVPKSIKLTGITISVVMIVSTITKDLHPFANASLRFAESAIGVFVGIAVVLLSYYIETTFFKTKKKS